MKRPFPPVAPGFVWGTFQSLQEPSIPAVTIRVPSGLNAQAATPWLCPMRTAISSPESAAQSLVDPSFPPVRTLDPSGEKTQEKTAPECPSSVARRAPVSACQMMADPSVVPVTTRTPSGLKEHAVIMPSEISSTVVLSLDAPWERERRVHRPISSVVATRPPSGLKPHPGRYPFPGVRSRISPVSASQIA